MDDDDAVNLVYLNLWFLDDAADLKIIKTEYEMIAYDRKWFFDQNILNPYVIV